MVREKVQVDNGHWVHQSYLQNGYKIITTRILGYLSFELALYSTLY